MFKRYFILFLVVFFISCANPKPPSGGEPDRTPPKVIKYSPENYSVNFREKQISIEFSKWVERASVINNIYLNLPLKYEIVWSGKKMYLRFAQNLPDSTTITFLLGNNYSDLDGNKPNEPFTLVFSTGPSIDSSRISGFVLTEHPQKTFIYAFPSSTNFDTIVKLEDIFHYRTQPNVNGYFNFEALKEGDYHIVAFLDNNNNRIYDKNIDGFGVCSKKFSATYSASDTCFILLTHPYDFVSPQIIDINSLNKRLLKITFSEPITFTSELDTNDLIIIDSSTSEKLKPEYFFIPPDNRRQLFIWLTNDLGESLYTLSLEKGIVISDTSGNRLEYEKPMKFKGSNRSIDYSPDTFAPSKLSLNNPRENISLKFNKPIDIKKTMFKAFCLDNQRNDTIWSIVNFLDAFTLNISCRNLRWGNNYSLEIFSDTIYDKYNYSFQNWKYSLKFSVQQEPRYGNLKGKIISAIDTSYGMPTIFAFSKSNLFYTRITNNSWDFENIPEGEYILIAFYDKNNNGVYDYGNILPLIFSERIIKISDKIKVRKGWTVEEVTL
ncbi:MAG: Ig-like domain-containing protein [Ignavibacteria bacterium]|nr:Ig-like domain-containing protein [Ignavibacteria bacterium]